MAAFHVTTLNGVYPKEMVQALQLFIRLPCPETAAILIGIHPEFLTLFSSNSDAFGSSSLQKVPRHMRGSHFDRLDEWLESFDQNLRACDTIHEFLLKGAREDTILIDFHGMRDQNILFRRLSTVGFRKSILKNRRQFLRDKITRDISAFRSVSDLICIHGVAGGRERFWNALGAECSAELHLQSEILYDLSTETERFAQFVHVMQPAGSS
jgi:hypothetical protein